MSRQLEQGGSAAGVKTARTEDYVAAGYFLSRYIGARDCTGTRLRRLSLAADHSPRKFFPDTWTLSWCKGSRQHRIEEATLFGISEGDLDRVMAWADQNFDKAFGAWSVFFSLEEARTAARSMLSHTADLDLWGVGLHRDLLPAYCEASRPAPPKPEFAPTGASGTHVAACVRSLPLAEGGTVLGHELLVDDPGCAFNSPESRHLNEPKILGAAGVAPNSDGLVDSFDEALASCKYLDTHASETQHRVTGWRPWLIVCYQR